MNADHPSVESVWDYPRPPRLERTARSLKVMVGDRLIAETRGGFRVLETSHPPTYYFPPQDVATDLLRPGAGRSICEYKGQARYWDLVLGERTIRGLAWSYPQPTSAFAALADHLCFYASKADACFVEGEAVAAQDGDFYGGWITSHVTGPFKGAPGTRGW